MAEGEAPIVVEVAGPVQSVPVPARSTDQGLLGRAADLVGWSLRESTGTAAAAVEIYDGSGTGGTLLAEVALASGASDTQRLGETGIRARVGLYLHVVSGSVTGAVHVRV